MSPKHATDAVISKTETRAAATLHSGVTATSNTAKRNRRGGSVSGRATRRKTKKGLSVPRLFSQAGVSPFDELDWDVDRVAEITDDAGNVIFRQENVEVPKNWSILATKAFWKF